MPAGITSAFNDYDDLIEDENHHEENVMMTCRGGSGDNICMMMI